LDGLGGMLEPSLLVVTLAALVAGGLAWLAGAHGLADLCWALGKVAAVLPAIGWVIAGLVRRRAGVDLIAVLALIGTLAVRGGCVGRGDAGDWALAGRRSRAAGLRRPADAAGAGAAHGPQANR
jgi:hypothetical protein